MTFETRNTNLAISNNQLMHTIKTNSSLWNQFLSYKKVISPCFLNFLTFSRYVWELYGTFLEICKVIISGHFLCAQKSAQLIFIFLDKPWACFSITYFSNIFLHPKNYEAQFFNFEPILTYQNQK